MKWKAEKLKEEFWKVEPIVRFMALHFEQLSIDYFGIEPTVTRILEPIEGATKTHPSGRAIDIRDEYDTASGRTRTYTDEQVKFLISEMNKRFPGNDDFATAIHHSFKGGPQHIHLQRTLGDKYDKNLDCYAVI